MNPDSGKHFKLARPSSEAGNESFPVSPGASRRYTDPAKCLRKVTHLLGKPCLIPKTKPIYALSRRLQKVREHRSGEQTQEMR
jgi:hypothetical protein